MFKKLIMMTDINIKGISRCAGSLANESFFDKIKHKSEVEIIVSQFFYQSFYNLATFF